MAVYNEINVGRLNRFLQKYLQLKGGPPAPQLAGDIQTSLSLFNGVENRYLEGWNRYCVSRNMPLGGAGNRNGSRLRNPAGSNVIAVIEKITLASDTNEATFYNGGTATTDLPNVVAVAIGSRLDARGQQQPTLILSEFTVGTPPTALTNNATRWTHFTLARTPYDLIYEDDQQHCMLPGDAIQFQNNVDNIGLTYTIQWRERFLEESERT